MTISKKLFLAALVATGSLAQATSVVNDSLLKPWIDKAKKAVNAEAAVGTLDMPTKVVQKNLYKRQKQAFKAVRAEAKYERKSAKSEYKAAKRIGDDTLGEKKQTYFVKKQITKALRHEYDNWKDTRRFTAL